MKINGIDYYTPDEKELKIGDELMIGTFVSDESGFPLLAWKEIVIEGLPLYQFYPECIMYMKRIK